MDQFKGKVAVVTGAGSGIGRGLAVRSAREGMHVALADLHEGRLDVLRDQIEQEGVQVLTCALDVSDAAAMQDFASQCCNELGAPALLFNNAGVLRTGETWSHSPEEWQQILSINVMGVVNGLNAFMPPMLESGTPAHIVNTGSVGSLVSAPRMAQYTAVKMAVRGITECLAFDLAASESSIDVSLLCPGPVLTSISDDLFGIEPTAEVVGSDAHMMAGQPDFITPDDCADHVFKAIRERKFWIFTHPVKAYLGELHQDIVNGDNPVFREVVYDANT